MAKKKEAEAPAGTPAEAPAEKMTQREAVELALKAGKESPADGVAYVKEKFDITLNNGAFSTIKSKIKNSGDAPAKKPGRPAASANGAAPIPAAKAPSPSSSPAELAQAVKALVKQHGVEAIKQMADVFAE